MKIEKQTTPETIVVELGQRLTHRRIELGLTQAQAADQAGVGKRTLERIEAGHDTQLTTLIRLLRILDLVDHLDQLIPDASPSPMERLKGQPRPRKRATSRRKTQPEIPWKWGDEK